MDAENPFVLKSEHGMEIDLSPVLMPLLHAIREEIRDHEQRCHVGNGPEKATVLQPEDMYAFMVKAIDGVDYDRALAVITRAAIVQYLVEKGYKPCDKSGYSYRVYDGDGRVWVYAEDKEMNYISKHDAISRLARTESRPRLAVAQEVVSMINVLDQMAAKL